MVMVSWFGGGERVGDCDGEFGGVGFGGGSGLVMESELVIVSWFGDGELVSETELVW